MFSSWTMQCSAISLFPNAVKCLRPPPELKNPLSQFFMYAALLWMGFVLWSLLKTMESFPTSWGTWLKFRNFSWWGCYKNQIASRHILLHSKTKGLLVSHGGNGAYSTKSTQGEWVPGNSTWTRFDLAIFGLFTSELWHVFIPGSASY